MAIAYLSLGSNLKTPKRQLRQAIQQLIKLPQSSLIKTADFYFNKAWGKKALPNYYNTVVSIRTFLKPYQLLQACLAIENSQGRIRRVKNGARTLDIDILYFENCQLASPHLTLPHPKMLTRDFVMIPLNQIK